MTTIIYFTTVLKFLTMPNKEPKDKKTLDMNGFPIHLEIYDSKIIVKDENLNSVIITKKDNNSIVLNLTGFFSSKK